MKAVAPTTFARMSESLMSRKPLHKRLSRGFATRRSLPPIVEKNWRQKLPGGSPQGCEMPVQDDQLRGLDSTYEGLKPLICGRTIVAYYRLDSIYEGLKLTRARAPSL